MNRPYSVGVAVNNDTTKSQPCKITIGDPSQHVTGETSLNVAPGSRHIVPIQSPIGNYYLQITIESSRSSSKPTQIRTNPVSDTDTVALVLTRVGTEFAYLAGYKALLSGGDLHLNYPPREAPLPTSFTSYLGHDLIILYDLPRLNLAPEVLDALIEWTRVGGTLVLVSNGDAGEYRGTVLAPLVDDAVGRRRLSSTTWARPLNEGQIIHIAVPVTDQKRLGLSATQELWKSVFQAYATNCPFAKERFAQESRLAHPSELPTPSAGAIAWYLVIYVLVVIPANYWILRRKDKMLWLIVTVPVVSSAIAGISFAVNAAQHGSETVLRELGVAVIANHSAAAVSDHGLMLFSPRTNRFKIEYPKNSYLRPLEMDLGGYSQKDCHLVSEGDSSYYRDYTIPMWSLARFRSTALHPLDGPVHLAVEPSGSNYRLKIENGSGLTLSHCSYTDGRNLSQFFDLGPGTNSVEAQMHPASQSEALAEFESGTTTEDKTGLAHQIPRLMRAGLIGWSLDLRLSSGVKLDRPVKHFSTTLVLIPFQRRAKP